jgi:hypothetical protein
MTYVPDFFDYFFYARMELGFNLYVFVFTRVSSSSVGRVTEAIAGEDRRSEWIVIPVVVGSSPISRPS